MTNKRDDVVRDLSSYPPLDFEHKARTRRIGAQATGAAITGGALDGGRASGAAAAALAAIGASAIGALAIGALAIGKLYVGAARFKRLEIDELIVKKLTILEH